MQNQNQNNELKKNKQVILLSLPIGNLQDLTLRIRSALEDGKYFVAEDTRVLKKILGLLKIPLDDKLILSFHDHSSDEKVEGLIEKLHQYRVLYVVSDAGSPVVSDPAFPIVKKAIEKEIDVSSFPGPSSITMGLELSALPPIPFHFHGFFPRHARSQEELLEKISIMEGTHLFFESPERIINSLNFCTEFLPTRRFAIVKEMTKKFEKSWHFQGNEFSYIKDSVVPLGEFVFLFHISKEGLAANFSRDEATNLCQQILDEGTKPKLIAKLIAQVMGRESKEIYQLISQGHKS